MIKRLCIFSLIFASLAFFGLTNQDKLDSVLSTYYIVEEENIESFSTILQVCFSNSKYEAADGGGRNNNVNSIELDTDSQNIYNFCLLNKVVLRPINTPLVSYIKQFLSRKIKSKFYILYHSLKTDLV